MTPRLKKKPQYWLTPKICEHIFIRFIDNIRFDEPIPPFETRFPGRLEGIVNSVQQTYGGRYLNPTILDAASAYFNQLVRGHAFKNGNKRLAVLYTHLFLLAHGIEFTISDKGMYNFAVLLARASEEKVSSSKTKEICEKIIEKFTKEVK